MKVDLEFVLPISDQNETCSGYPNGESCLVGNYVVELKCIRIRDSHTLAMVLDH